MNWREQKLHLWEILHKMEQISKIQEMKNYPQHKITNSFLYSHNVAVAAFYFTCKCK